MKTSKKATQKNAIINSQLHSNFFMKELFNDGYAFNLNSDNDISFDYDADKDSRLSLANVTDISVKLFDGHYYTFATLSNGIAVCVSLY